MKNILQERPYMLFLVTALCALAVAVIFKGVFQQETLDVSIYNHDYSFLQSSAWFVFSGYLFFLSGIYYLIRRMHLKTMKRLVSSHYVFIALFLLFYIIFSLFSNPGVQKMISGLPLSTLITVYGLVFLADLGFFIFGVLLLLINLFSLKKDKSA